MSLDEVAPSQLPALRALLTVPEQRRADGLRTPAAGRRFTVRRALLRVVLGGYVGRRPGELRFARRRGGKPILLPGRGRSAPHFNASHSDRLAVVAVSWDAEVGVDLERVRPDLDVDAIVARYFSTDEARPISLVPPDLRQEAFFETWTLKESCCKALGTGLRSDLRSFTVPIPCVRPAAVLEPGSGQPVRGLSVVTLGAPPGYAAGIALRAAGVSGRR